MFTHPKFSGRSSERKKNERQERIKVSVCYVLIVLNIRVLCRVGVNRTIKPENVLVSQLKLQVKHLKSEAKAQRVEKQGLKDVTNVLRNVHPDDVAKLPAVTRILTSRTREAKRQIMEIQQKKTQTAISKERRKTITLKAQLTKVSTATHSLTLHTH